jgi:hypothetical protein
MTRRQFLARTPWLLLVLALAATDLPVVHEHDSGAAGIYNEACPLARLAAPPTGAPAGADPPARALALAGDGVPLSPATALSAGPLDDAAARAPPAPDPLAA